MAFDPSSFEKRFQELKARFNDRPQIDAEDALADFAGRQEAVAGEFLDQQAGMARSFEVESAQAAQPFEHFGAEVTTQRADTAHEGEALHEQRQRIEHEIEQTPRRRLEDLRRRGGPDHD